MEVTCKTLQDQRRYKFLLNHQATVADLIQQLKCELGASNEYTLICLGKMMQGRDLVSSYGYSDLIPIIVMITSKIDLEHQEEEIRWEEIITCIYSKFRNVQNTCFYRIIEERQFNSHSMHKRRFIDFDVRSGWNSNELRIFHHHMWYVCDTLPNFYSPTII